MSKTKTGCIISKDDILAHLAEISPIDHSNNITILLKASSTNDYLSEKYTNKPSPYKFAIAEEQTAGKGTNGRSWSSPHNTGIWLSFTWQTDKIRPLLPAYIATAVHRALDNKVNSSNIKIKWRNDLYCQNKKLGGILIESYGNDKNNFNYVIGIGINVYPYNHPMTNSHISLSQITADKIDRNKIIARIITNCQEHLKNIGKNDDKIIQSWNKADLFRSKEIKIKSGKNYYTGQNLGLDENGSIKMMIRNEIISINYGSIMIEKE